MKTKTIQKISADTIAEELRKVSIDFYTKAEYLLLEEGIHRKTWCACVYQMMSALGDNADENGSEFDRLAFLDKAGFFRVADHESMSNWTYCTKREDYIEEE